MNDFIKQQQELARVQCVPHKSDTTKSGIEYQLDPAFLDTLTAQIITNVGEELLRLAEGEKKEIQKYLDSLAPRDMTYENPRFIESKGVISTLDTIKQHITNVTGVEEDALTDPTPEIPQMEGTLAALDDIKL